ncbi:hypothetical protein ILUMI_26968 [Ignelater luminosus]|uniref:Uncharacterized protein n=1 Tax=Ignelater luminosus TaxID=2038154 RepID=A0A8K0C747_IGNLU|nr:hypothetical protein ILUMI_26968 [Ignelater luminosus]
MEYEISLLQNLSNNYNYHVDDQMVYLSFLLESFLTYVNRQFKRHFLYAEGFMLNFLQTHRTATIAVQDISDLLAHLHTPVIYAYMLMGGLLLSLLAIPCVWCFGSCTKKHIDVSKYQCCFPVEILIFVLFTICLVCGITSALQLTIQIQNSLTTFPVMYRNMVQDLCTSIDTFRNQVRLLVEIIGNASSHIANQTYTIPQNLTRLLTKNVNPSLENIILQIGDDIFKAEIIFNKMDFATDRYNITKHIVEITIEKLLAGIKDLLNTTSYSKMFSMEELKVNGSDIFIEGLQFPNWKIIHDDLQMIFRELWPTTNNSLFFVNNLNKKIENYSFYELEGIRDSLKNLQELSVTVERNITHVIKMLFPKRIQEIIVNGTYVIDHHLSSFALSSTNTSKLTSGNFWIMLLPSIYATIAWVLFFITFIYAIQELKKIVATGTWPTPSPSTVCVLRLFQISMVFSATFLWIVLGVTIVFYCIYLPLAVFCEAVNDKKIFYDYLDKSNIWNNKTWLDTKLEDYLPKHSRSLKIHEILEKCSSNKTIYASLNMDEIWNVTQYVDDLNLTVNIDVLQTMVAKAIKETTNPDVAMKVLLEKIFTAKNNLELHFIPVVVQQAENFHYVYGKILDKLEGTTTNSIVNVVNISRFGTEKNLKTLINHTQNAISYVFGNISKLVELKYHLKNVSDKFNIVHKNLQNLSVILKKTSSSTLSSYLNATVANVESMIIKIKKIIKISIKEYIGNCYVLPFIYDKASWSVCGYGLSLVTGAWITLGLICISIIICVVLSCRISGYIRGSNNHNCLWRQQLENQRYSSQTSRFNGTMLFDSKGNFMGSSVNIKKQSTRNQAT